MRRRAWQAPWEEVLLEAVRLTGFDSYFLLEISMNIEIPGLHLMEPEQAWRVPALCIGRLITPLRAHCRTTGSRAFRTTRNTLAPPRATDCGCGRCKPHAR